MGLHDNNQFVGDNSHPTYPDEQGSNPNDDYGIDYDDDEFDNYDEGQNYLPDYDLPRTLPNTNMYATQDKKFLLAERKAHKSLFDTTITNNSYDRKFGLNSLGTTAKSSRNKSQSINLSAFPSSDRKRKSLDSSLHNMKSKTVNNQDTRRLVTYPPVDTQDILRSQLDALGEVKRAAEYENIYSGFPVGLETKLIALRDTHTKLLQLLRERTAKIEEQKRHEINANVLANIPSSITNPSAHEDVISSIDNTNSSNRNGDNNVGLIRTKTTAPVMNPEESQCIQQLVDAAKGLR